MTNKPVQTEIPGSPAGEACHIDNLPRIKAAGQSCSECPFRKSNIDRPHFNNQYSQTEFARLWRTIAVEGQFFGCHLTDADYHPVPQESLDMGYQKPADIGARRECAGSVALIRRDLRLAESYPNHSAYIKARPAGLSSHAFLVLSKRLTGMMEPPVRFAVKPDESDVIDPMERIDTSSIEWAINSDGAAALLLALESVVGSLCECPVCNNYTTAHTARPFLTADGDAVDADEELHGLLTNLAAAGIRTMDKLHQHGRRAGEAMAGTHCDARACTHRPDELRLHDPVTRRPRPLQQRGCR
jgi:hypothetical protein